MTPISTMPPTELESDPSSGMPADVRATLLHCAFGSWPLDHQYAGLTALTYHRSCVPNVMDNSDRFCSFDVEPSASVYSWANPFFDFHAELIASVCAGCTPCVVVTLNQQMKAQPISSPTRSSSQQQHQTAVVPGDRATSTHSPGGCQIQAHFQAHAKAKAGSPPSKDISKTGQAQGGEPSVDRVQATTKHRPKCTPKAKSQRATQLDICLKAGLPIHFYLVYGSYD